MWHVIDAQGKQVVLYYSAQLTLAVKAYYNLFLQLLANSVTIHQ